jgi:membrane-bound serine protease (ClpP class)
MQNLIRRGWTSLIVLCAVSPLAAGDWTNGAGRGSALVPSAETLSARKGAIVPITGDISDVTTESLRRRIELAKNSGAEVIVFEINTPGGTVNAAVDICNLIKNLTDIETIAWVNSQAMSAGSMISLACNRVVMASASMIGDCGVLMASPMGGAEAIPEDMRAKAESPVLSQFRDSANRNGYSNVLCESLVIKERVVWWLENTVTGEREFVGDEVKADRLGEFDDELEEGEDSGEQATRQTAASPAGPWVLVESYIDPLSGRKVFIDQPIVDDNELLTMTQSEAIAFGIATEIVSGESGLQRQLGLSSIERFDFVWSELVVRYLTSMPVRVFLLVLILLGAYIEFHTPGVGVPGLAALICLTIFVGAPYLTGLASVSDIVLIAIGIVLIVIELFVIPGFGVTGIAGVLCVLLGIFWTFVPAEPSQPSWQFLPQLPATWAAIEQGLTAMCSAAVISIICMVLIAKHLPKIPMANRLVLSAESARGETLDAGRTEVHTVHVDIGARGVALSTLRPAGRARIGGRQYDVVTDGDLIGEGAEVEVVDVLGNRVVVASIERPSGQV